MSFDNNQIIFWKKLTTSTYETKFTIKIAPLKTIDDVSTHKSYNFDFSTSIPLLNADKVLYYNCTISNIGSNDNGIFYINAMYGRNNIVCVTIETTNFIQYTKILGPYSVTNGHEFVNNYNGTYSHESNEWYACGKTNYGSQGLFNFAGGKISQTNAKYSILTPPVNQHLSSTDMFFMNVLNKTYILTRSAHSYVDRRPVVWTFTDLDSAPGMENSYIFPKDAILSFVYLNFFIYVEYSNKTIYVYEVTDLSALQPIPIKIKYKCNTVISITQNNLVCVPRLENGVNFLYILERNTTEDHITKINLDTGAVVSTYTKAPTINDITNIIHINQNLVISANVKTSLNPPLNLGGNARNDGMVVCNKMINGTTHLFIDNIASFI